MSWAVGFDERWKRDIGYGVPSICDYPGCDERIDRGLGYVCGGEPYGGESGCGLFFCGEHLGYDVESDDSPQLCERCQDGATPYSPKLDLPEWVAHKATDPSWEEWRQEQVAIASKLAQNTASPGA